jgi:hypothetical protein
MKQWTMVVGLLSSVAAAAAAQSRAPEIPRDHRPPAGMCRIWLANVPAGQQPAPTDCPTAVKNRPANGRVIFGDDFVQPQKKGEADEHGPMLRTFVHPQPNTAEHKHDERKPDPPKKPDPGDRRP